MEWDVRVEPEVASFADHCCTMWSRIMNSYIKRSLPCQQTCRTRHSQCFYFVPFSFRPPWQTAHKWSMFFVPFANAWFMHMLSSTFAETHQKCLTSLFFLFSTLTAKFSTSSFTQSFAVSGRLSVILFFSKIMGATRLQTSTMSSPCDLCGSDIAASLSWAKITFPLTDCKMAKEQLQMRKISTCLASKDNLTPSFLEIIGGWISAKNFFLPANDTKLWKLVFSLWGTRKRSENTLVRTQHKGEQIWTLDCIKSSIYGCPAVRTGSAAVSFQVPGGLIWTFKSCSVTRHRSVNPRRMRRWA